MRDTFTYDGTLYEFTSPASAIRTALNALVGMPEAYQAVVDAAIDTGILKEAQPFSPAEYEQRRENASAGLRDLMPSIIGATVYIRQPNDTYKLAYITGYNEEVFYYRYDHLKDSPSYTGWRDWSNEVGLNRRDSWYWANE